MQGEITASVWSHTTFTHILCQVCGGVAGEEVTKSCASCHQMFHDACLPLSLRDSLEFWKCGRCRDCDGCGVRLSSVICNYDDRVTNDINDQVSVATGSSLCSGCVTARAQGSFCPLCQAGYSEEDYDSPMMECSACGG